MSSLDASCVYHVERGAGSGKPGAAGRAPVEVEIGGGHDASCGMSRGESSIPPRPLTITAEGVETSMLPELVASSIACRRSTEGLFKQGSPASATGGAACP